MGRSRFVIPNTVRLELSEGDWIEVKERLTYGEQQALAGASLDKMTPGSTDIAINLQRYDIMRLDTWIVRWSFCDANGKAVKKTRDAIAALDPATAKEINDALRSCVPDDLHASARPHPEAIMLQVCPHCPQSCTPVKPRSRIVCGGPTLRHLAVPN